MSSSDAGLEQDTLVNHPFLSLCHVLNCLARVGVGQLDIVVSEADNPLVQEVAGAVHLLGLFSNQVPLDFSTLVVG